MSELVGMITIKAQTRTVSAGETASNQKVLSIPGGTAELRKSGAGNYWFIASFPATRILHTYENRLFHASSAHRDDNPTPDKYHRQFDAFGVAKLVGIGEVVLDAGWEVEHLGEYSDGSPMGRVRHSDPDKRHEGV